MSEQQPAPTAKAGQNSRNLWTRAAAALVLAPIAIAAAYAGGWWWSGLVVLGAVGLYVEWLTVVRAARPVVVAMGIVVLALAGLAVTLSKIDAALLTLAVGFAAVSLSSSSRAWAVAGLVYAAAAELASILVRHDPVYGFVALILILFVVWATDIGGYIAGRSIGGPKLAPNISPNKTWAGALGGFLASLMVAVAFAAYGHFKKEYEHFKLWPILSAGAALSIAAQLGDLFESAVKRKFGVKDSSHIIPGHGGLMDRLDGYVAAVVVAAVFGIILHGVDGVGRALMIW